MLKWFYRFTAAHFILTSVTGLLLYLRPTDTRPGWYPERAKEILVGLHNGEFWGLLLFDNPYLVGLPIGTTLAGTLAAFSIKAFRNGASRSTCQEERDEPDYI